MTFLEAAKAILAEAREPLTATEITTRAVTKGLLTSVGKTPEATMRATLGGAFKRMGAEAEIVNMGRGKWALHKQDNGQPAQAAVEVKAPATPGHWLLVCNPSIYDVDELFRKGREVWGGDEYIKSPVARKRIREEMKVGDTAVIYRTKPKADLHCEVRVVAGPRETAAGWVVDVEPVCKFDPPVRLEEMRACPELSGLEFLQNSRVSVSHVSPGEYKAILGLVGREQEPADEYTHDLVHWQLIRLGRAFGCDVWVAPDCRGHHCNGDKLADLCLPQLPELGFNQETEGLISGIDCLWLRGSTILAAFEIEHTTSIYSGLLRLSDLVALQPNISIDLFIVAPDSRRPRVVKQVNRPTFNRLPRPLNQMVKFIPYHGLNDLLAKVDAVAGFVQERLIATIAENCY